MRKAILTLMLFMGLYDIALADSALRIGARRIIESVDEMQRTVKLIWESEAPAGASDNFKEAWNCVTDDAREVYYRCDEVIRDARYVEQGDESKETINTLNQSMHKLVLALNAYSASLDAARRIQHKK